MCGGISQFHFLQKSYEVESQGLFNIKSQVSFL